MRWVTFVLALALVGLQYNLWISKGGWRDMWQLDSSVTKQETLNEGLVARNRALAAEVRDLSSGHDAVAEIARYELGYVRDGEIFYRLVPAQP